MRVNAEVVRTEPPNISGRYSFGLFEVDFRSNDLRKCGLRIRIQDQPLQVLSILLSRHGEIVTREELRRALWPADTFVDFDHGLNSAVKRLRQVLADDPERPHYIETLPRHGYRFIGPLKTIEAPPTDGAFNNTDRGHGAAPGRLQPSPRPWFQGPNGSATGVTIAVFAVFAVLAGCVVAYRAQHRAAAKAIRPTVVLAVVPFKNISSTPGQPAIAEGITEELITELGKVRPSQLGVIAWRSPQQLKNAPESAPEAEAPLLAYKLEGSVRVEGARVRVSTQLIKMSSQTDMWAEQYDGRMDNVLELQSDVAHQITLAVCANLNLRCSAPTASLPPSGSD